ncbi:MAG: iron chelate uptake ABC transporter family permease subunit, partial [Myxococcota bacterium]
MGSNKPRLWWVVLGLGVICGMVCGLSLMVGQGDLGDPKTRDVLLALRLYRTLAAFGAGAALAMGGVLVQGLFRNPLASPSVLGTSAGASLGGQIGILAFNLWFLGAVPAWIVPEMMLPLGCVAGALVALGMLLWVAERHEDR